jgi:hypothetical protein
MEKRERQNPTLHYSTIHEEASVKIESEMKAGIPNIHSASSAGAERPED